MTVTLRFGAALNTAHPADLTFNAAVSAVGDVYLAIHTTMPAPTMVASLAKVRSVALAATMPAPAMVAVLDYDNAVFRGTVSGAANRWQVADKRDTDTKNGMQNSAPTRVGTYQPWQEARRLFASSNMALQCGVPTSLLTMPTWTNADRIGALLAARYDDMTRMRNVQDAPWQEAGDIRIGQASGWQERFRRPRPLQSTPWQDAAPAGIDRRSFSGVAKRLPLWRRTRWQAAIKPAPGHHGLPPIPVTPPGCYTPPAGGLVALLFAGKFVRNADLRFACSHASTQTVIIPIRNAYIVINEVHLKRVDGNIDLLAYALSLSIDMDSWTWGFTASLPAAALSLLEPAGPGAPVELEATVNGQPYRLLAEAIQRNRQFGKSDISLSGRGRSAMLADPYSPVLSFTNDAARTAQQLMNDALTTNGVSLGWGVDWRIDDWIVPAGTWRHQGTYMSAANAIAAAAGAFIQPDPVARTLRVRPRYPALPWEWQSAAPDIELPSAAITKEGITWSEKPHYNAVYVSGAASGGVLGHVKRAGSAGDLAAPMITDALITAAVAARQRGASVLADTGRGALYSLSLPVLPETGIIEPGALVRYVDSGHPVIGVVKGVSVDAVFPSVRQTIEVQTHG